MRGRYVSAFAAPICLAIACGGGAFTAAPDDGSGGSGASAGEATGGTKASGGTTARAGSSATTGGKSTGGTPSGGVAGTVVSDAGMQGDSGAPVVSSCMSATQCKASSLCREATCTDGECGEKNLPDGAYKLQVPGDCQELRCQGGQETIAVALTDSDDLNECTTDSCGAAGKPIHTARLGQVCANGGGICSGEGQCELCNRNLCPVANECQLQLCKDNGCHLAPKPVGTLCAQQTNQCNGDGGCVDCTDNGGCDEASVCNNNQCIPVP